MTIINKIECKNFKSFANKTEIPFGKDYNMIIGANGAGKSNIVDLICFVLGKSSAKSLRAEKSANLIYNGGKKNPPAKEAYASIYFDNTNKTFSVKEKELKITRKINQKGNSTYLINDQVYTKRETVEMLSKSGIDPDGHNIILQGDIIHFTEMKPEERREVLEEISGISIFEDKKEKSLKELEKVDEKLNEAEIILTERQAHLKELKKERDQALQYKEMEKNIKRSKATFIHSNIKEKKDNIDQLELKIKSHTSELNKLNAEIQEVNLRVDQRKNEIKEINEKIKYDGEEKQPNLSKEIDDLKVRLVEISSRMNVCKNEIERATNSKNELSLNIQNIDQKIESLSKEISNFDKELKDLKAEETDLNNKIIRFKQDNKLDQIEGLDQELNDIEKSIDAFLVKVSELNQSKGGMIRENDLLNYKVREVDQRLNEAQDLEQQDKVKLIRLNNSKKEFEQIGQNLSKALNENSAYSAQLAKARESIFDKSDELTKLKFKSNAYKDSYVNNQAINVILNSKIEGVLGLVKDLGKVAPKHASALNVAAGQRLFSVVVKSDQVAADCIEYLKQNRAGVVTFLPLNKIQSKPIPEEVKVFAKKEGVIDLALNLISYDNKLKTIFSYVFGQTLVVENILAARRLGIGKARMVTTEGDLVEMSGAMVGGYRAKGMTIGFQEKKMDSTIEHLEQEVVRLNQIINNVEIKKSDNDNAIMNLRERKALLDNQIKTLEEQTKSSIDTQNLKNNKISLLNNIKENENKIKSIIQEVTSLNKLIEEKKVKKLKLKEKLNIAINPKLSQQLEINETNLNHVKESIIKFETSLNSKQMEIREIHQLEKERILLKIKEMIESSKEFSQELSQLKQKYTNQTRELKSKENEQRKFHGEFKNLFDKRDKLNGDIQNLEKKQIRAEEKIKLNEERIHVVNLKRAELVGELEGLNKEFEEFADVPLRKGTSIQVLGHEIKQFESSLKKMGNVNLRALDVYERIHEEFNKLNVKSDKLREEKEDVLKFIYEIESQKKDLFMKTFNELQKNFKQIFGAISKKGGEAYLEIEDTDDPFAGGVDISVKLSGTNKSLDIKSLSGGEKTITALALIFAIQEHNPASFYIMDEVDAALDKSNSELLSKLIGKYSRNAQYIVISHNDTIISEASQIYGVSMQEGISKVFSLKV